MQKVKLYQLKKWEGYIDFDCLLDSTSHYIIDKGYKTRLVYVQRRIYQTKRETKIIILKAKALYEEMFGQ